MELRNLTTFIRVSELRSFSEAARQLEYSQSAVSTQIKQLELELETPLFERIGRTVTLTAKGHEFLEYAQEIIRISEKAQNSIKNIPMESGVLRIAMAESLCISFFPEILRRYHECYPRVHITIKTGITDDMFKMLLQNEVDMIYTLDERIYQKDLNLLLDEPEPVCFVAPKGHPLENKKNILLEQLISYPFVLTEKYMSYRHQLDQALAAKGLEMTPDLELGNTEILKQLVLKGMGLSFLPRFVVQKELETGKLIALDVSDFSAKIWRQLIEHKGKWVTPAMKNMTDLISRQNKKLKK